MSERPIEDELRELAQQVPEDKWALVDDGQATKDGWRRVADGHPSNGQLVAICRSYDPVVVKYLYFNRWKTMAGVFLPPPTHWIPLPADPEESQ